MSRSTRIIAGVLVFFAVLLGILSFMVGRKPPPEQQVVVQAPVAKTFPVVVANRALNPGEAIPADAVAVVNLPVQPTGAYVKVEDVIGHTPRVGVPSGMPLTESGLNQGLPLALKVGERGVAIPVDEITGAGNAVQAGDFVDVFVTMRATEPGGANTERSVGRLLLSHLRVLSYGMDSIAPTQNVNRDSVRQQARSAVLAVPLEDVGRLVLAAQAGKLTLALRYPKDDEVPDPALFVTPPQVIAARAGLPAAEKARLDLPENRAYAGVDSLGLAGLSGTSGKNSPRAEPVRSQGYSQPSQPAPQYVEVVRGAEVKRQSLNGGPGVQQ